MKNIFFVFILLLTPLSTFAYVPQFWHIMSRTAENHGRGIYQIEQDVTLLGGTEPIVLHETWLIESENQMRVTVTGKGKLTGQVQLTYLYDGSIRYFVDETGNRKAVKPSSDWFEPYFHFRYSKNIKPIMNAHNIIPASAMQYPARPRRVEDVKHEPEDFVRLSRVGGVVTYGIGQPTPVDSVEPLPGLWIEQDKFVIRKLRLPSKLEITASKYNVHNQDFWLPSLRQLSWPGHQARIQVNQVKYLGQNRKFKDKLNPNSLDFKKDPLLATRLPDDSQVRAFYDRFR